MKITDYKIIPVTGTLIDAVKGLKPGEAVAVNKDRLTYARTAASVANAIIGQRLIRVTLIKDAETALIVRQPEI